MSITQHTGFLVVLLSSESPNGRNPRYCGVNRIPAYPTDFPQETLVIDDYVFGAYKNLNSNLIDDFSQARELLERFCDSPREFELIGWCRESEIARFSALAPAVSSFSLLGSDVAVVGGDYWSIVEDIPESRWADKYVDRLNEYGLLPGEVVAMSYLNEYRQHAEADADCDFEVGSVLRIARP
jgi:hypothetical protein